VCNPLIYERASQRVKAPDCLRRGAAPSKLRRVKCLKCGCKLDLSAEICAVCGTPLDADGDGLPDVLGELVERKARAIVEAERAKLGAPAAPSKRDESAVKQERLATCRRDLERNRATARPMWLMNRLGLGAILIFGFVVGGIMLPACGEPLIWERSLVAAPLLCPIVCEGCSGPGRIFTWHERSNTYEGNVSTQLCTTPKVDVSALRWIDVTEREEKDLRPYRLTLWASVPFDFALVVSVLSLIAPFWFASVRKKLLAREQSRLEAQLQTLERG